MQITSDLLKNLFPNTPRAKRDRFVGPMNDILPKYGIVTELRVSAFLATTGIESDRLNATEEYASGWAYDISRNEKKARALGNLAKGDGPRYKGRSLIQTTGKFNYKKLNESLGKKLNIDFVANPERLAEPRIAVEAACVYWTDHKFNLLADKRKFFAIQGLVNRGQAGKMPLHWPERLALYERALRLLPDDFRLQAALPTDLLPDDEPSDVFIPEITDSEIDSAATPAINPANSEAPAPPALVDSGKSNELPPTEPQQIAENITNVTGDKNVPDNFVPEDKEAQAPAKEGSTETSVKMTIAGFVLPASLALIIQTVKDLISQGFVNTQQLGELALGFIKENTRYVFYLIALIIVLLIVKKVTKQISFWIEMYSKARSDMNNVNIIPGAVSATPNLFERLKFWK